MVEFAFAATAGFSLGSAFYCRIPPFLRQPSAPGSGSVAEHPFSPEGKVNFEEARWLQHPPKTMHYYSWILALTMIHQPAFLRLACPPVSEMSKMPKLDEKASLHEVPRWLAALLRHWGTSLCDHRACFWKLSCF